MANISWNRVKMVRNIQHKTCSALDMETTACHIRGDRCEIKQEPALGVKPIRAFKEQELLHQSVSCHGNRASLVRCKERCTHKHKCSHGTTVPITTVYILHYYTMLNFIFNVYCAWHHASHRNILLWTFIIKVLELLCNTFFKFFQNYYACHFHDLYIKRLYRLRTFTNPSSPELFGWTGKQLKLHLQNAVP